MKKIFIDLDGTLTLDADTSYLEKPLNQEIFEACRKYKDLGFKIIISSNRFDKY